MKTKRAIFWIILVVFIALGLFWVSYYPYDVRRLYRAVPLNAVLVSEHYELGRRWPEMAANPVVKELLKETDGEGLSAEIIKRVAGRQTVIAYVPVLNAGGESAWVFASWIGRYAQLLRLGTLNNLMAECTVTRVNGRKIWSLLVDKEHDPLTLSLAVSEGALFGCLSKDPLGVVHVARRAEAGRSIIPELEQSLQRAAAGTRHRKALDRGWLRLDELGFAGENLRYDLTRVDRARIEGEIAGDHFINMAGLVIDKTVQAELAAILQDAPIALSLFPLGSPPSSSGAPAPLEGSALIAKICERLPENSIGCLGLFGGDYSGRVLVKVPAVLIGLRKPDQAPLIDWIAEIIDSVNSTYGLGLIPRALDMPGIEALVLDSAKNNIYRNLDDSQKVVVARVGNWILLSSNLGALERLLANGSRVASADQPLQESAWLKGFDGNTGNAYLWVDLAEAGQSLRSAIAAYSLVLMAQNKPGSSEMRSRLDMTRRWIEHIEPLEKCAFTLATDPNGWKLRFGLGPYE